MAGRKRRRSGPPHFQIPHYLFDSPAYRSLGLCARALLSEICRRFNGSNNGRIGLGQREATEALGLKKRATVAAAFRELEAKGFIVMMRAGAFSCKLRQASEWYLTWHPPAAGIATQSEKGFMRWKPPAD